jgi:RNA polymerase sigma factor (TIGR02999 family)
MMSRSSERTVTRLLQEVRDGDRAALDQLFPLVYDELRGLAHGQRRRWYGDETLGTTALVHEAYLKLVGQQRLDAHGRAHFLAIAARAMRHILSNYSEARRRLKRGGDLQRISLDALEGSAGRMDSGDEHADALAALEGALRKLDQTNERLSRIVECRFLAGMSISETALALDSSPATVKRDWVLARAWLYRELQQYQDL